MLVGDRSKSRPLAAGDHIFFSAPNLVAPADPWTISRHAKRICFPSVLAACDMAGNIDSNTGNANATPVPWRNVRRERCFFVINTNPLRTFVEKHRDTKTQRHKESRRRLSLCLCVFVSLCFFSCSTLSRTRFSPAHLEWSALYDSQDEHGKPIIIARRLASDGANRRHVG